MSTPMPSDAQDLAGRLEAFGCSVRLNGASNVYHKRIGLTGDSALVLAGAAHIRAQAADIERLLKNCSVYIDRGAKAEAALKAAEAEAQGLRRALEIIRNGREVKRDGHTEMVDWEPGTASQIAETALGPADPDLGKIGPGHVCKHDIRWPHACDECDRAALVQQGGGAGS